MWYPDIEKNTHTHTHYPDKGLDCHMPFGGLETFKLGKCTELAEFGRFISSLPNGGSSAASWDRPVNSIP